MTDFIRFLLLVALLSVSAAAEPIDREALVTRHHPVNTSFDSLSPFTVGNGGFAMTVDATGLQSFPDAYTDGIPLCIQSDWGWHSFPNEAGYQLADTFEDFATGDRQVPYPTQQSTPAGAWLRSNPHRLGLARIGFEFLRRDGTVATMEDITHLHQELRLWEGIIRSTYLMAGVPVTVETAAWPNPDADSISFTVESDLIDDQRLRIVLEFPYGRGDWGSDPHDWSQPDRHTTTLAYADEDSALIRRQLDATRYTVTVNSRSTWKTNQRNRIEQTAPHRIEITPLPNRGSPNGREFSVRFAPGDEALNAASALSASRQHWRQFWTDGAAVDFSGSTDPRAPELERRVILSQYLTAIQCAGDMPPQETGLTGNSWYGVAHLEMHWWHGVHFALWNRFDLLERSLPWYEQILPTARGIAVRQGYAGARWPKMVDREGREKPSGIAPLLIWQQPHPITFAELAYRERPTPATLARYATLVEETAAFMASFPLANATTGHLDLGPPVIPAQESYDPRTTRNPPYELAYWRWGLEVAQQWRERQGQARNPAWDAVLEQLAPYPTIDDVYATAEGIWNPVDHPSVLATLGVLPGPQIDRERLRRTLHRVMAEQDWDHTWGWDYPMIAMTAARLGEPALAVDALLLDRPKNTYLNNGHNHQDDRLRLYLPGNGALLTAVAMMAGGWDGAPDQPAPGFPTDGTWTVRAEGLHPLP